MLDSVVVADLRSTVKGRTITVSVTAVMMFVKWSEGPVPSQYIVTSNTGFRAELKACIRDECLSGEIKQCTCRGEKAHGSVNKWLAHSRGHCHEWHVDRVSELARGILKSYKSTGSGTRSVGAARGSHQTRDYVPCPSWPVERGPRVLGGVSFTDGRQRPSDYGFDIHSLVDPESHD